MSEQDDFLRQARLRALMEARGKTVAPEQAEPPKDDDRLISEQAQARMVEATKKAKALTEQASTTLGGVFKGKADTLKAKWNERREGPTATQQSEQATRVDTSPVVAVSPPAEAEPEEQVQLEKPVPLPTVAPVKEVAASEPIAIAEPQATPTPAPEQFVEVTPPARPQEVSDVSVSVATSQIPIRKTPWVLGAGVAVGVALTAALMAWHPWNTTKPAATPSVANAPIKHKETLPVQPVIPATVQPTVEVTKVEPSKAEAKVEDVAAPAPKTVEPKAMEAKATAEVEKSLNKPKPKSTSKDEAPKAKAKPNKTNDHWQDDAMDELDEFAKDAGIE
jgi:hypothetical protein